MQERKIAFIYSENYNKWIYEITMFGFVDGKFRLNYKEVSGNFEWSLLETPLNRDGSVNLERIHTLDDQWTIIRENNKKKDRLLLLL